MAYKIYLSPSNQGGNKYATGGTNEMAQCDKIAKAAYTALTRCGFSVKLGKSGDTMQNRCSESDAFKADIHMPIHTNAFDAKTTGGTLVMLYKSSTEHNKAGKALLDAVGKISPGKDYALRYRTDLYELSAPAAISLYLEVEFHDTKTGSDWIRNNINNIGEAIAKGMCNYFGVTYKAPASAPSAPDTGEAKKLYYVQAGAFSNKTNADALVSKLKKAGFDAIIKTE
ncbi:MAG: N-acetylmuramoyl-L-alanine amidase [Ruminococcus sp.]|nr:N-acetylmuramoyl-L-alanine amidase [Ruminococcus sp.]